MNLRIISQYDLGLTKKIPDYGALLRILCDVRFKTPNSWTEAEYAILDTGAHTSLLPLSLWKELDAQIVTDYFVRGLVPKEECKIDVKVGWVKGKIVDKEGNSTPETRFRAFLALTDNIPLIVGFKDLLERYHIDIDATTHKAYIEIK
mgnify:CR=1 FL=1